MSTSPSFASLNVDLLVIGVGTNSLDQDLAGLPEAFAAQVAEAARADEFKGKPGSAAIYPTFGAIKAPRVALVGVGDRSAAELRKAAGKVGYLARDRGAASVSLNLGGDAEANLSGIWESFWAGNYRFDKYKPEAGRKLRTSDLQIGGVPGALAKAIVAGQNLARDIVSEPAAVIFPESLAAVARGLEAEGLEVEVWDEVQIREAGMGGITAVGQGSSQGARFIHIKYVPAGTPRKRLALVGKGVTFDAGGLSIKPSSGMQTMRCDMAGSAAVIGTMKAVAALKPDVEVHGIIGAVENMLGGNAFKLGDILHMYNGKKVEVFNTDAEGRLVLADCLHYACQLGVDAVVDIATLTGAAVVALGEKYTVLFSKDDALVGELSASADAGGELVWRLPLPDFYKDMLKAEWGDLKNVGGRSAGSITAALFLSEFVEGPAWAHLDIAGPSFNEKTSDHFAAGGTGCMVPTLTRWVTS